MIIRISIALCFIIQLNSFGQVDSVWNVMLLKNKSKVEIKDNMATYSPTGFNMYRNCFYDVKLKNKPRQMLRLIDIRPDTLVFIGISQKKDNDLSVTSKDTFRIYYPYIEEFRAAKDWLKGGSVRVKSKDHRFVFYKSPKENRLESRYACIFSSSEPKSELIPTFLSSGIAYCYEFGGQLYRHSEAHVQISKDNDEEKAAILNGVMTALDFLVNKQINIRIEQTTK